MGRHHFWEDFPDFKTQCQVRPVPRNGFSRTIEQIDLTVVVRRNQTRSQAIHDSVTKFLKEGYLSFGFFQFHAGFPPTLRQEIREKGDGTEGENAQADDVLQRWKVD